MLNFLKSWLILPVINDSEITNKASHKRVGKQLKEAFDDATSEKFGKASKRMSTSAVPEPETGRARGRGRGRRGRRAAR